MGFVGSTTISIFIGRSRLLAAGVKRKGVVDGFRMEGGRRGKKRGLSISWLFVSVDRASRVDEKKT